MPCGSDPACHRRCLLLPVCLSRPHSAAEQKREAFHSAGERKFCGFSTFNESCIPWCPPQSDCRALNHCHNVRKRWGSPRQKLAASAVHFSHQPVRPPPWQPGPWETLRKEGRRGLIRGTEIKTSLTFSSRRGPLSRLSFQDNSS